MLTEQTSSESAFIQGVNMALDEMRIFSCAGFSVPMPHFSIDRSGTQASIIATASIPTGEHSHVLLTASFQRDICAKWIGRAKAMMREACANDSAKSVLGSVSEVLFEYYQASGESDRKFWSWSANAMRPSPEFLETCVLLGIGESQLAKGFAKQDIAAEAVMEKLTTIALRTFAKQQRR